MKIICESSTGREEVSDWLVAENINRPMGEKIVYFLNSTEEDYSNRLFVLVDDDYKLYSWKCERCIKGSHLWATHGDVNNGDS